MSNSRTLQQIVLAVIIGVAIGCCFGGIVIGAVVAQPIVVGALVKTPTPTPTRSPATFPTITLAPVASRTPTPAPYASLTPMPTAAHSASPTPNASPTMSRTPAPTRTPRPIVQHFLIGRPVALSATAIVPALTYLYGTTSGGQYDVHHGEEFVNPTGTPLYAVGDGAVVTAGNDAKRICGDDGKKTCGRDINFYGNVVVIRLDQTYNDQPIFVLYGHMNKIGVNVGDRVKAGDSIGEVGMTGIALGPHVHFEVRIGVNDYAHTRNPILWMPPLQGRGALAGRFVEKGALVRGAVISLSRADPETYIYSIETYGHDDAPPINSDDTLGENFVFPDLAAGDYIVRVSGQQYASRVTVQDGKLAYVELGGP